MKLSDITSNDSNPRTIADDKLKKLKKSIKEFPKMMELRPIIIDSDNTILAGNMRYAALKALKYKDIPDNWVKRADQLTEEEKQRFIIADNVGFGEWDWEMILEDWDIALLEDWGMHIPKSKVKDSKEAQEDNFTIPKNIITDIVPGDLYELKGLEATHHLLCGDTTDLEAVERLMGDRKADLIITDPPYNIDYKGGSKVREAIENDSMNDESFYQFLYDAYVSLFYTAKPGCGIYVFHADSEGMNFRKAFIDSGWKMSQTLIWLKNNSAFGRQDYHWKHEPILYGWKEGAAHNWYTDRKQTTVLEFDRPSRSKERPTMKPIELLSYMIKNSSKPGDTIVDLFGGSGSTMVAGHQIDRPVYMNELDPIYCQVILDRMKRLDPDIQINKIA